MRRSPVQHLADAPVAVSTRPVPHPRARAEAASANWTTRSWKSAPQLTVGVWPNLRAMDDDHDMAGARAGMRSRPQPTWRGGRLLRAVVFALLSSALAVVGHHLASQDSVSWRRTTVGALAVFALSWPAVRPSVPALHVLAATGTAQLLLHGTLSLHGHVHDGALEIWHTSHRAAWAMTATHCVAACVMALLMHQADQAWSRLPATLGQWAQAAVAAAVVAFGVCCRPRVPPDLRSVRVALGGVAVGPTVMTMLWHAVVRRGPPAGPDGLSTCRVRSGPRTERVPPS